MGYISVKTATKKWVCSHECVWLRSGACCKGLRYPLLLSIAAMGLVVPGGHRWHRNPPSRSEKVTQNTGETPPHLLTQPFTAANRFLGQDCARAFSLSSILWMLHNHSFQVRNRGRNRNAFKMSNDNRSELQCHWWYRGEGWIQWETCGTIEENRFIKALLLKCLIRHEMQERKDRRREMYKKKSVPINTNWADGQLLIPFEGHFWPLHFSFSHSFVSVMVNVVMLGLQKGGLHSSSVVHFLPPYGCTVPRCRLVRQDHMARPAKQVVSSKTLPVSPVFMFSPKIQI